MYSNVLISEITLNSQAKYIDLLQVFFFCYLANFPVSTLQLQCLAPELRGGRILSRGAASRRTGTWRLRTQWTPQSSSSPRGCDHDQPLLRGLVGVLPLHCAREGAQEAFKAIRAETLCGDSVIGESFNNETSKKDTAQVKGHNELYSDYK